jgi:hypothetical protein
LDQVTSVSVSNGLIGKLLEYGKIRIASPSGSVYFQRINSPFDFTMDLMEQVEKRKADSKNMLQQGVQQAAGQSAGTQAGSIKCISGVNMGAVVPVAAGERIIIGRDPAFSHFIIKDNRISKKHCIIAFDGGSDKYIVRDVSMNGVYLENGTRLEAGTNVKLSHGTAIRIGKSDNVYKLI